MKKFSLTTPSSGYLPISFKVYEYFEKFIIEEVLEPKRIILRAKPNVLLAFSTVSGGKNLSKRVAALKIQYVGGDYFSLISIPGDTIAESTEPYQKTVELIYEGISLFFTKNFKSIRPEFMKDLWSKVDLKYLLGLPYPASESEIRRKGD